MKRNLVRLALLAVSVALIAVAFHVYTRPRPVAVTVLEVDRGPVEATVANTRAGTVKACRRARISPQTGGLVASLPVRRGDRVKADALLLELWNADLRAQVELARAESKAAEALTDESCLAAELAEREDARVARLFADGIVDDRTRDRTEADRKAAAASCAAARANLEVARDRIFVVRTELDKTILRAPFAGVVAELNAELGEVVTPSPPGIPTPPAVDLIEEGCLYVVAPLDEVDGMHVRRGQVARVTLDAFVGRTFRGTVRRVAPYVVDREKQARTVDVEVDLEEVDSIPGLAPGYSADVEVLLSRREDTLRVRTEAVMADDRVLVVDGDVLVERSFEAGVSNWDFTEVLSGLAEGEAVVLSLDREGVVAGALAEVEGTPTR